MDEIKLKNKEKIQNDFILQNKSLNISTTQEEWTKLQIPYKKVIEKLKELEISFTCKKCSNLIFTNHEIIGLYIVELNNFALIVDPKKIFKVLNLSREKTVMSYDKDLKQKDCLYYECTCNSCNNKIGNFLTSCPFEKSFVLNKIIISEKRIDCCVISEEDCYYIKLKDYIDEESIELKKELEEVNSITKMANEKFNKIFDGLKEAEEYLQIKDILLGTELYLEELQKLSLYSNYLLKNK